MVRPPYPVVVRLCALASLQWAQIDAAYYQINLVRQPPYRFANLVYAWAVERVPSDDQETWHQELTELLPWQDITSEAAIEAESDSFMAMMTKQG